MSIKYAERMNEAKPSFIRESLKYPADPSIISFAGGNPDADHFPVKAIKDASVHVFENDGASALQYAITEGYVPLRVSILAHMSGRGVDASIDNIAILSGSQQGLDLTGKAFIDKDDVVIIESPSYMGAINAFKYYQPKFIETAMDENGMDMDDLEAKLKANPRAKFIYTIPDFQNPTGRTMSLERRQRIVELAEKYEVIIVEDSPYYDLRFSGQKLPPIKHFDKAGKVVYLGSMSKILCPAMRVGWVLASEEIVNNYVVLKQATDLHTNELGQRIISKYLINEDLDEHIVEINEAYRVKRDIMLKILDEEFPKEIKHTCPAGGLFVWLILPDSYDAQEIFSKAMKEEKVCFVPGDTFYPYGGHKNTIRLSFASMRDEQIIEGMKRLARVMHTYTSSEAYL